MRISGWPFVILLCSIAGVPLGDASAAEGQPPAGPNNLQAIDYALLPAGGALVKVVFTQPLTAQPGVVVNHHPTNRIAFDFPDTVSAAGKQPIEVAQRGLRSIRVVQSGTRTRLVVNLDRPFGFETTLQGKELLITLRRPYSGAARDTMRWSHDPAPNLPRHGLHEVGFQRGEAGEGRIFVEVSDATMPIEVRRQGNTLIVDFLDAQLPPRLARRLDVQDFGTSIRALETFPLGGHARMTVELAGAGEIAVYQVNRRFVLAPLQ